MKSKLFFFLPFLLTALAGCSSSSEVPTNSLYIASFPSKTDYNVGEFFSLDGLKVIDTENGDVISGYTSSISEGHQFVEADVSESKQITISKAKYKPTFFNITVSNLPHLELSGNYKTEFSKGEFFSLEGLVVTANGNVITDYSCNFSTSNMLNTVGEFTVIISKTGYWQAEYQIEVFPNHALFIKTQPTKTNYEVGDTFSTSGLEVVDEKNRAVIDYSVSIKENATLKYSGDFTVSVMKDDYESAGFNISVEAKINTDVSYRDLTIYYMNDTHGSFIRNDELNEAGMSVISAYIKNKVNNNPNNSLVLSGGDMFQGGYESNETRGNIMIDAMNEIGFDAMVLGNHEFDWGIDVLSHFQEKLNFPLLSSNTFYNYDRETRPDWVSPYTVIERGDLKIGIIGGLAQGIETSITGSISDNFYFPAANRYVKEYSTYLRLNEGCDLIIAAFHDEGFDGYQGSPTRYEDLTEIDPITNVKYVDAMFFAHDHLRKEGEINEVPYLEAGCNGKIIGELTLSIENSDSVYQVESNSTHLVWASDYKATDPKIDALTQKAEYKEIIDNADVPIYTFTKSYNADSFTVVICKAMYWYVNTHKDEFDYTTVYLASHNTGGVRSVVNAGVFTRRDLIKVIPFDNLLSIQTCTSRNISNILSSEYYGTYQEGEPVYNDRGHTHAVSITYITEYKYAYNYQVSYQNYDMTAREALVDYLISGVDDSL